RISASLAGAAGDLRLDADPAAAPIRKRYLKSPFIMLGCKVPAIRARARAVARAHPQPPMAELLAALTGTWDSDVHEERLLAVFTAQNYRDMFTTDHVAGLLKTWLKESSNWDFVDAIATGIAGQVGLAHAPAWKEIESWAHDPWLWLRRASLLAHIPAMRESRLEKARFRRTCQALAAEREFFVEKALGWALRELGKKDAAFSETVLLELGGSTAPLTRREATRRLPAPDRKRILAALGQDRENSANN
ncbi:MAG: DNA alkylation repair protein, partial [Rhodospirillales bacterium]|nr:DNA alkylation repair protein [Rhodospirillales bacterium]